MKPYLIVTTVLCVIMIFFPLVTMVVNNEIAADPIMSDEISVNIETNNGILPNDKIRVIRTSSGKVIDLDIFDYIVGVVAAEMSVSYEKEALKAQAVAAYTYALWIKNNADSSDNALYDISDSGNQHQTYFDSNELKKKWGDKYETNIKIIKDTVNSVLGEYLAYENEPILCVYHSISSGSTQSAENGWGSKVPYLKCVTAPGDTLSPEFDSEKTITLKELLKAVSADNSDELTMTLKSDDSGYVKNITVNDKEYSGIEFAAKIGLKSPCFTFKQGKENVTFTVKGKGHGIGMSQYSADYMARQGADYEEILLHFYPSTTLIKSN